MTIASLAMYRYTHLRPSYDRLWASVSARLPFDVPPLDWSLDPQEVCRRDDLLLAQTCAWPLITALADTVRAVGTFDYDVDGVRDGTYRSVFVGATPDPVETVLRRPGVTLAANSDDSLSGWVSVQWVAKQCSVDTPFVVWTGAHAASVDAVEQGRADLASIDAVSWAHLGNRNLHVVGRGPRVPCLPLVTAASSPDALVDDLRGALAAAVADPAMRRVCDTLRIRAFLPRERSDYESLRTVLQLG